MLSNVELSYISLAVGGLLFLWLILSSDDPKKDELWNKIDKVGVPSGFLPWTRAIFASWTALLQNTHEGYNKFCKQGRPFALPTIWTGKAVVVVPPSALHLTNRPDNELIAFWALVENIQLPYFIPDCDVFEKVIHFEVSRKDLTKRNVSRQLAPTAEEVDACFRTLWGDSTEWTTVNGWDMCGQIIARVALRTLLGFPACRDEELVKATRHFANNLFTAAGIINCMPPALRPILAPILALPTKRYRARYRKIVIPVIRERILLWEKYEKTGEGEGELPSDFLQWLIVRAAQHGPEHLDPSKISYRLLALNTMFVYAMSFIFAQTVIDVCASPDHKRFMDGMEAECKAVVGRYPEGLASGEAVEQFHRVDSAIRESMRISDVGVATMPRDVVGNKPLDLGNGIICPPGTRLMYPTQPIHVDPDFWEDPLRFDAFRFSDPFDKEAGASSPTDGGGPAKQRENLVDLTTTFLAWGYGKKACPGRWYAGQTIKQSFAYMVMNYEVELIGKPPKRKALLNAMIPPTGARLRFRRRV
ncbi:cytochrome P450 [Annulohypoxylon bovei var. microspora]|nr:cytochrome P450 [Annulohypoxylon bovei var. microspora]